MYLVPDSDSYYLSKIRINLRKKFNILSYLMINYIFDNIFFINVRNNVQIPDSGLRIRGSEKNIYGSTTVLVRRGFVLYSNCTSVWTAAAWSGAIIERKGCGVSNFGGPSTVVSVCRTTGSINKDDPT